jgi:DUF4097 and DUF4098 domain-containing protein YvlB
MRTTNKSFVALLLALFALLVSFGCSDVIVNPEADIKGGGVVIDHKYKARESFSYKVELTGQTSFRLEGINGSVDVKSVSGTNQVIVTGEKVVGSDSYQDAADHLKYISIDIDEFTDELLVKTLQPKFSDGRGYNVNYTISVPASLNLTVKNVNGKITGKTSVPSNGTVDMTLSNGSIELNIPQRTSSDFSASLVNGSISVQNLTLKNKVETKRSVQGTLGAGEGLITLRTTNGNITAFGF